MVDHYVVHPFGSMSRDSYDGGVGMYGVGVPDLVIGQRWRGAEHDAFLHPVNLLLSGLYVNQMQSRKLA